MGPDLDRAEKNSNHGTEGQQQDSVIDARDVYPQLPQRLGIKPGDKPATAGDTAPDTTGTPEAPEAETQEQLRALIKQLGSDDFFEREEAQRKLSKNPGNALSLLTGKDGLGSGDAEIRARIKDILEKYGEKELPRYSASYWISLIPHSSVNVVSWAISPPETLNADKLPEGERKRKAELAGILIQYGIGDQDMDDLKQIKKEYEGDKPPEAAAVSEIYLIGTNLTDADFVKLQGLRNLKYVTFLDNPNITSVDFAGLPIKELRIVNCRNITDAAMTNIGGLTQLRSLRIDADVEGPGKITEEGWDSLRKLKELVKLDLSGANVVTVQTTAVIATLPKLEGLTLSRCGLTDDGLGNLQHLKRLKYLDMSRNYRVTDAGLKQIAAGAENLIELNISECRGITNDGLSETLPLLPELETILDWKRARALKRPETEDTADSIALKKMLKNVNQIRKEKGYPAITFP